MNIDFNFVYTILFILKTKDNYEYNIVMRVLDHTNLIRFKRFVPTFKMTGIYLTQTMGKVDFFLISTEYSNF